ncbi:MAG: DUF3596 domain-containing protein [Deltaproteobacteria bacterium]|nr:DUF3596 domain-containing protein [Deltaproteobacteria bacterium]
MQVELHQLVLRYQALRIADPARQARMTASIAEAGQQSPVLVDRRAIMSNMVHLKAVLGGAPAPGAGTILRKKGSKKLYVDFYYQGRRVTKSTGLDDSPRNRKKVQEFLDAVIARRDKGTLVFSEAFPGATDEEKAWFAQREGWEFSPGPKTVTFGDYLERWERGVLASCSEGKQRDYRMALDPWIRPWFKDLTFQHITGVELKKFLMQLSSRRKGQEGQPLSPARIRNILIPLRMVWNDACEEYRWELPDPFRYVSRRIPRRRKKQPEVFRFEEWRLVLAHVEPHYRPIAEVMIMTGMIASEIAGLRKEDVQGDKLLVRNSIVKGREKPDLKNPYREGAIPLAGALKGHIETAGATAQGPHLYRLKSGQPFDAEAFRNHVWKRALRAAGVAYRKPYAMRHTFAAWSLTVGEHPNRLVNLMGHASKQMVYDVYGRYVEGLEADREAITEYFRTGFTGPDEEASDSSVVKATVKVGGSRKPTC